MLVSGLPFQPLRKPEFAPRADLVHPINRDLSLWYPIVERGGLEVWDISTLSNHGALVNMTNADWQQGELGPALNFGGTDTASKEHINVGGIGSLPSPYVHTFSCRAFIPTTSEDGALIKVGTDSNGWAFGIGGTTMDNSGNNLIGVTEAVAWRPSTVAVGTGWHHIGYTWSGLGAGQWEFFLDGEPVFTTSTLSTIIPTLSAAFGSYPSAAFPTRALTCKLADIRVWTRVLDDTEMRTLWKDPLVGFDFPIISGMPGTAPPATFNPALTRANVGAGFVNVAA